MTEQHEKIRIVFDGPPGPESGRFVEVENERGEGLSFGEWKHDSEFWYLEFDNPAIRLNEYEKLKKAMDVLKDEMEASVRLIEYLNNKLPEKERLVSSQAYADILKDG